MSLTLTILTAGVLLLQDPAPAKEIKITELPPFPVPVASFGGAVSDGWLYVYSGHIGTQHAHSKENLYPGFLRLNLADPEKWEELPGGQPLQGMPLVSHSGKLYRVGGLSARNEAKDKADLHSVETVAEFDPATKKWVDIASLPEGRSSHDAVAVGDKLYVIGGWKLAGEDQEWLPASLVLDLKNPTTGWKKIADPPFQRRALAVAAARNKIYALGGMDSDNKPSAEVDVYDIATDKWSKGPAIPGSGRNAFGIAAVGIGDDIYTSTLDGAINRLNEKGDGWDQVGKLPSGRFFHRLLSAGPDELVIVAGANMKEGHLASVGLLRVK